MLTQDEIERYKRQLVLKEIGGEGQQKLKAARVLVVGAGGLGSPLILYLAAAGIGQIGIIDSDRVSLDNLHRQVVHDTKSVGKAKTRSAAGAIERLNPHVETRLYTTRLVPENAERFAAVQRGRGRETPAPPTAAFSPSRRLTARCRPARRRAFSARSPA